MRNKIHDAFDSIQADPQLMESTKQYLSKQRGRRMRTGRRRSVQRALAAACAAFFAVAGAYGYNWAFSPVSYLSIDVNPSIELALSRFDRVVSVTAYNAEGTEIVKGLSLTGKKYTDAIDSIVGSEAMGQYLTGEFELYLTVAAEGGREDALAAGASQCLSHSGHGGKSVSADLGVASQAHEHGMSTGKYYAWLTLTQYDGTITVEDCKDMELSEIHGQISEHEHNGGHGSETGRKGAEEDGGSQESAAEGGAEVEGTGGHSSSHHH